MKPAHLLSLLLLAAAPATAQQPAAAAAAPTLRSDLRAEYLAGEALLVRLEARNDTAQTVTMPDLSVRHDLVRFEMKFPSGQTQNRNSRVDEPTPKQWSIPPRGAKEVLLELPAGSTLRPGEYQVAIHIKLAEGDERTLPPQTLRLAAAAPVSADLAASAQPSERTSDLIPWVHKGTDGYDLYLFRADNERPTVQQALDHLARLPAAITPTLTASRAGDPSGRLIVWQESDRRLRYAALEGHRLDGPPGTVDAPWPKIELAAQGATATSGTLYQPLWIPAPRGDAGELRMATVSRRGSAAYRRIGRYDKRPELIQTFVDDAGSIYTLVSHGGDVDLFTVRGDTDAAEAAAENLPLGGRRLQAAKTGVPITAARFAALGEVGAFAGGPAIFVLERPAPGVLAPRWYSLGGKPLDITPPRIGLPDAARLIDVSAAADGTVGALMRLQSGELRYVQGDRYQRITGLSGEMALDRSRDGQPLVRALGAPLLIRALSPDVELAPPAPPAPAPAEGATAPAPETPDAAQP